MIQDWFAKSNPILAVGTDHGGWEIKQWLIPWLEARGFTVLDCGPYHHDPADDYPCFAHRVARAVSDGDADVGLLICRSGVGMGICANRYPDVRAVVAYTEAVAKASRDHNCANLLVLPADYATEDELRAIAETWLKTPFSNAERHIKRLEIIEAVDAPTGKAIAAYDPELATILTEDERKRVATLDLVASESVSDPAVRTAMASQLTDKYAEGYPGARLYPDCTAVDKLEQLCIARACKLFGAEAANVQPYSGSIANLAVYLTVLGANETVLAMNPAHGGHATHFSQKHISGRAWKPYYYDVDVQRGVIDYNIVEKLALGMRPKLIVAGGSAYLRNLDFKRFREIADKVGAVLMVDMAHVAGLVAAGCYNNPVSYADFVTTTTHKTLCGPRGGLILCREKWIASVNKAIFPLLQGGPLMHVIAAKTAAFGAAMSDDFKALQQRILDNARALCELFAAHGVPSVSDGTDCHMTVLDLRSLEIDGITAAAALEKANINVNPMRLLSDGPDEISGIRIGTPVISKLGMTPDDMPKVAEWILRVCRASSDASVCEDVKREIAETLHALRYAFPGKE